MREQFTFYRSFYKAVKKMKKSDVADLVLAVCAYALDEEEPKLSDSLSGVFELIRPTLDASARKAENRKNKTKSSSLSEEQTKNKKEHAGTNEEQNKTCRNKQEQTVKENEGEKEREVECERECERECESECESEREVENECLNTVSTQESVPPPTPSRSVENVPLTADGLTDRRKERLDYYVDLTRRYERLGLADTVCDIAQNKGFSRDEILQRRAELEGKVKA